MGNVPSHHIRIWNELSRIENEKTRLKLLDKLLEGPEYVQSFKKMNLHNDLMAWSSAIKRGTWAEWPNYNPPAQPNISSSTSLVNAPTRRAMDYLNEAYDLLGLSDDEPLNLETLKIAYKKRAVIFHPDKGGDPAVFDDLTKAYLYLQEVYKKLIPKAGRDHADSSPVTMEAAKARRVDKTIQSFDDEENNNISLVIHDPKAVGNSKPVSKKVTVQDPNPGKPIVINPKQLDMNVFNQLFEQNRLPDPEKDDGYGDWLASQEESAKKSKNLRGKFSIDVFNKTFEEDAEEQARLDKKAQTALTIKDPDAMILNPNAVVLGGEKPAEYTAPHGSNLNYTDLKAAYSRHMTFSQQIKHVKVNDKSFEQAKAEREKDPGPASQDEMRHMEEMKLRTEQAEQLRKTRLAALDTDISHRDAQIKSRLLITGKSLQ
jgi:curved DNA-binding protein CbpA